MTYRVRFTTEARDDLERLFDFLLEASGDWRHAERAIAAIEAGTEILKAFPYTCRKAGGSPFLRELLVSFGHTGYVLLFEIGAHRTVTIAAVRHQRESDYH